MKYAPPTQADTAQQRRELVRAELERRRDALRERYLRRSRKLRGVDEPRDLDVRPIENESQAALQQLEFSTRQQLEEVLAALERFDAGKFGQCTICGDPITLDQLEADPATRLCRQCAMELQLG